MTCPKIFKLELSKATFEFKKGENHLHGSHINCVGDPN